MRRPRQRSIRSQEAPAGRFPETPPDRSAAARLWSALRADGARPRPAQAAALNAALVLLADHELAASTFAARVAASAWADPYRVVLAGLGPLGGSLHGGAALAVDALLTEAGAPAGAFAAVDRRAATGQVPGFGHRVYRGPDPRARHLLERLDAAADDEQAALTVKAALEAAASLGLALPNVDFALAALARAMQLRPGAASTIFTFARIVGLVAHALEEYPHRLRFRPRATYVGLLHADAGRHLLKREEARLARVLKRPASRKPRSAAHLTPRRGLSGNRSGLSAVVRRRRPWS